MPYIKAKARDELNGDNRSAERKIANAGELNYMLTCVIKDYLRGNGKSYAVYNDVLGALEGCKLEFYRRLVAPYEDTKITENGDVY